MDPLIYKVLPKRALLFTRLQNFFRQIKVLIRLIYNSKNIILRMRKKSGDEKRPIEVDPISGEYSIKIPEWMINELSWYEDTEIIFTLDGNELILSEEN